MSSTSHVLFLSYASQDAEAALRICETLRAAGIEVFLDQSELRGGDAWDQRIRHEIHNCALFVPIVSRHTQERLEGYFRHEWKLAIERTHHMAEQKPFLVPVVVDGTGDQEAFVPDAFRAVQWTRLPSGDTPPAFVDRIKRLLSFEVSPLPAAAGAVGELQKSARASSRSRSIWIAFGAVIFAVLTLVVVERFWISKPRGASTAFVPPPHSIAVLPFVNMSGDKEQDYFSDGLTEELLNSLAEINELQVAARTSAFSFKGTNADIGVIARKLNVGTVLEGSVRRSGNTIRITTELISAITGFHLWSHTYDRDLGDVLKLQTEIATAVASTLKITLLGNIAARVELGGTRNPDAFDAYLRGVRALNLRHDAKEIPTALAAYTEAIRLDPRYALAFADRSIAHSVAAGDAATPAEAREGLDSARADAHQALTLAPDLAQAHLALAVASESTFDFTEANSAYERALALAPGNAQVLRLSGYFAAQMGHFDTGIAATRRAVALDPLARQSRSELGRALYFARRYDEAVAAFAEVISLDPDFKATYGERGLAYYGLGDLQHARVSCEVKAEEWGIQQCLAVVFYKLGRRADAQAEFAKMKAALGDDFAYQYATIFAQWGNRPQALQWLERALRLRDPGLEYLKTDPLLDPLRQEPRFQAIERELKFPS